MGPAAARTLAAAIRLENDSFCGTSHQVPTLQLFDSSLGASRLPVISGLRRSNPPLRRFVPGLACHQRTALRYGKEAVL